jgi:hypothetical protein
LSKVEATIRYIFVDWPSPLTSRHLKTHPAMPIIESVIDQQAEWSSEQIAGAIPSSITTGSSLGYLVYNVRALLPGDSSDRLPGPLISGFIPISSSTLLRGGEGISAITRAYTAYRGESAVECRAEDCSRAQDLPNEALSRFCSRARESTSDDAPKQPAVAPVRTSSGTPRGAANWHGDPGNGHQLLP